MVKCLINLCKRPLTVDVTGMFDGTETVLLYGRGADILDLQNEPIADTELNGEVTLNPWEFWIVSGE